MKKKYAVLLGVAAAILLAPLASHAATTVETFTGSGTVAVDLPGQTTRTGTKFTGELTLSSLTFGSGVSRLNGEDVDFAGQEAAYLGKTYIGSATIPAHSGPATVTITGSGTEKTESKAASDCNSNLNASVQLGSSFDANYLDVSTSNSINVDGSVSSASFNSISPSLSASNVAYVSSYTITSVDAANGLFDLTGQGSLLASPNDDLSSSASIVPTELPLQPLGLGLLLVGIVGFAAVAAPRQRFSASPDAA